MHNPSSSSRNGFTLIEMLVVIAIIALIISLLFPATQIVMDRSKQTACMSQLRELGRAMQAYEVDEGHLPGTWDGTHKWMHWLVDGGYAEDISLYYCPSRPISDFQNFSPVGEIAYNTECSYGYNDRIGGIMSGPNAKKIYQVGPPAQIVILADSLFYRLLDDQDWQWWYHADPRHRNKANVCYADGHVVSKSFDDIYKSNYF